MKRSNRLIFVILIIILMIVVSFIVYRVTKNVTKSDSTNYTVDRDAKTYESITKQSIEAYLNQDKIESTQARNQRLKQYFVSNSPVFNRDLEINTDKTVTKTTANTTSIRLSVEDSDSEQVMVVLANVTYYKGTETYTKTQRYLVYLSNSNGSFMAQDVKASTNE